MSQFDTTPISYTGDEFTEQEKAQFKVDWDLMGKDFSNATGTLADGNLSSNVALKNIDNNFSANQTINGSLIFNSDIGFTSNIARIYRSSSLGTVIQGHNTATTTHFSVISPSGLRLIENPVGTNDINFANGDILISGTSINTAGALSNVAYLNQANIFRGQEVPIQISGVNLDRYIRFTEGESTFQGAYINYDGDGNVFSIGTHSSISTDKADDIDILRVSRGSSTLRVVGISNADAGYQVAGTTVIDGSRNFTGGSGSFSGDLNSGVGGLSRLRITSANNYIYLQSYNSDTATEFKDFLFTGQNGNYEKFRINLGGTKTTGNHEVTGTVTATGGYQVAGTTVIDGSRNFTGGSGSFSVGISINNPTSSRFIQGKTSGVEKWYIGSLAHATGGSDDDFAIYSYDGSILLFNDGSKKLETTSSGINVTGTVTASGGYLPFTGVHIARSDKDLKVGELVKIESKGWINEKQPDWVADYCNGSEQGVYGIVYNIVDEDIMEDYTEIEPKQVMITEKYIEREVQLIDGEYQIVEVEKEREVQAYDEFPIKDSEEMHKVPKMEDAEVTKQRKVGSIKKYHIAATGDGFCYTDCPAEYGDYLIPSTTEGLVTVYKGSDVPKNFVGIAGETKTESGKIAWTKE